MDECGITLIHTAPAVVATNADGRVLFRVNVVSGSFSLFRSTRMTSEEKAFIKSFYEESIVGGDVEELVRQMNYETDGDVLCS
jgi:hypothetical protein